MSGSALHELRPRSATELYDAALHVCVHTRSELPVLALLGAAPLATCCIWLVWLATHGLPFELAAALLPAALVFRQLCQGAGGYAATRELEGQPISAGAALRAGLTRLPSMVSCTAALAFFQLVIFPITLGLSVFFLSAPLVGPLLIAEGSAHGWNFGRVARERLKGRAGAAATLRILHGVALIFLMANLHGLLWMGAILARSLFAIDVTFVDHFASLSHGFYDVCLLAVAQMLLDPVRCATGALLLADARVRHEGFDLLAALRRLRDAPVARAAAVILALGLGSIPATARADAHPAAAASAASEEEETEDPVSALGSIADELDETDGDVQRGLEHARALSPEEQAKLEPLVRSLDRKLDAADDEGARLQLKEALSELKRVEARRSLRGDPRAAAQRILAEPEFREVQKHGAAEADKPADVESPSWWTRFWKWVGRMIEKLLKREQTGPIDEPSGTLGIGAGTAQIITYGLVALAACVVLVLVYRLLTQRIPGASDAAGGEGAGSSAVGDGALDALARPAWVWSDEADRLAQLGRFREAMRSLYLALLAALHRRGAIDYHPALSNWDYCAHFRGEPPELPPFRELTERFEFGWYGRLGADADGYGRFRALCGPLLSNPTAPEAPRA